MNTERHIKSCRLKTFSSFITVVLFFITYLITGSEKIIHISYGFSICAILAHLIDFYRISKQIKNKNQLLRTQRDNILVIAVMIISILSYNIW